MPLLTALLVILAVGFAAMVVFVVDSIREDEPRAPKVGLAGALACLGLAGLVLFVPAFRLPVAAIVGAICVLGVAMLLPGRSGARSLQGAMGYVVGTVERFDERDLVFSRNFAMPPGSDMYKQYYSAHPEREGPDARRREKGGPLGPRRGAIDRGYPPNVAMANAVESFGSSLLGSAHPTSEYRVSGPSSEGGVEPERPRVEVPPDKATEIVKGFARYLGADLVGVCKTNPLWAYSHRGIVFGDTQGEWGKEIPEPLPYAVVIATEMDLETTMSAPHTPASIESERGYARGACVAIPLAQYFVEMGYQAAPQFAGAYDLAMVPLAVDAGLGELGRPGYLIAREFGPRVRLFAVTTDMPLVPDEPVDLGAEAFCERCLKCAETCPSGSIPSGPRTVSNGILRWKLDEDSCFDYWAVVGTGCSICMAICPFSRPNRSLHRLVRWVLRRSPLARAILPTVDNWVYGKKWHPRKVSGWVRPPRSTEVGQWNSAAENG